MSQLSKTHQTLKSNINPIIPEIQSINHQRNYSATHTLLMQDNSLPPSSIDAAHIPYYAMFHHLHLLNFLLFKTLYNNTYQQKIMTNDAKYQWTHWKTAHEEAACSFGMALWWQGHEHNSRTCNNSYQRHGGATSLGMSCDNNPTSFKLFNH